MGIARLVRSRRSLGVGALALTATLGAATLAPADPPAGFEVDVEEPVRGQVVTFTAAASCEAPVTCTWTDGDGITEVGQGRVITRSFSEIGTKTTILTVDDPTEGSGDPERDSRQITVINQAPVVTLAADRQKPAVGETVVFTSTASDPDGDPLTRTWKVDGVVMPGDAPSIEREFATPGRHTVSVEVTDGHGATVSAEALVEVPNGQPVALISATPGAPLTDEPVTFAVAGDDPEGGVLDFDWDLDGDGAFDDGSGATLAPVTFPRAGTRVVRVRVTDPDGGEAIERLTLEVGNRPPTANFTWTPSLVERGRPVTFTSQAVDPEGTELEQSWDLDGDGDYDDAFGSSAVHTFRAGGAHEVGLRVRDADGGVAVARLPVVAGNRPPSAAFSVSPEQPRAGATLELTSQSSDPDGTLTSLAWDLDGDGSFDDATGARAERRVAAAGRVTIGLRVTDDDGGVDVTQRTVEVSATGVAPKPAPTAAVPKLLKPFPSVRVAGRLNSAGAVFRLVSVRAPRGARVSWSCSPKRCRGGRRTARGSVTRIRALERSFRAGVVIEFRVTRPGFVGKYTRIQVRRNRAPGRRDLCLRASGRPFACPS